MKVLCVWCEGEVGERPGEGPDSPDSICNPCIVVHFPEEAVLMGLSDGQAVNNQSLEVA